MLTIDDIEKNVDYAELTFFDSFLMHDAKRLGEIAFVEKYKNISYWVEFLTLDNICVNFLISLVLYFANKNKITLTIDSYKVLPKLVLPYIDFTLLFDDDDLSILDDCDLYCIVEFKSRGILKKELTEVF